MTFERIPRPLKEGKLPKLVLVNENKKMKCVHGWKKKMCSEWSKILSRIEKAYSAGQRGTLMGMDQDGLRRWFLTCRESIFSSSKEDAHRNEWGQLCGEDTEEEKSFFLGKGNFQEKEKI